jgi:hypothetical protein
MLDKKEQARRNFIIQVHSEGGHIESLYRDLPVDEDPEMTEEQMESALEWSHDPMPIWNWEILDYRVPEPKIIIYANIYPIGPGMFSSQCFGTELEAQESAFDGCYRKAVKLIES